MPPHYTTPSRFSHASDYEDQRASGVRLSDSEGSGFSSASDAPPSARSSDMDESEDEKASGVAPDLGHSLTSDML